MIDALSLAIELYQIAPAANYQGLAWVYYDLWKNALDANNWAEISEIEESLFGINFQQDDMLHTQVYWLVVKTVSKAIKEQKTLGFSQRMFDNLLYFPNPNDKVLSLAFLNLAIKLKADWRNYLSFNLWANIHWVEEPAELEKLIVSIAKVMLSEQKVYDFSYLFYTFFEWIEAILLKHPELIYVRYYLVQLYIQTNELKQAQLYVKELVLAKKNDFWVWQLMANCYAEQPEIRFSMLCKAVILCGQEKMLLGVRQNIAELLIKQKQWDAAKYEIKKNISVRQAEGWKVSQEIRIWETMPEIVEAGCKPTYYQGHVQLAEDLLWESSATMDIVITKVDDDNKMANYISENNGGGKISMRSLQIEHLNVGDILQAYTRMHPTKNYLQVIRVKKVGSQTDWVKKFSGVIRINASGIGFIEDVFISHSMVADGKLTTSALVDGMAIKSFDHKKNKEGWKAIFVNKIHPEI